MQVVSSKIRKNKKDHMCEACCRVFGVGIEMNNVTVADQGSIYTWRECPACTELIKNYPEVFSDGFDLLYVGCVYNSLDVGETPEELLERFTLGGS